MDACDLRGAVCVIGGVFVRVGIILSYDGTNYCGWQMQKNGISVQQRIEEALERLTGEKTSVVGAGRTDAGVHAVGQTAHFDTRAGIPAEKYSYAMNTVLPRDIRVKESFLARDDFHARYDAVGKRYKYVVCNMPHASAVMRNFSYHEPRALNINNMRSASERMKGTHDFSAFCAAGAQTKTFVRTISDIKVTEKAGFIVFEYTGNGFLYNMVRIMTGTLLYVGMGKISFDDITGIIESRDRTRAGVTVPPTGLFLDKVFYENAKKA